jgi:hypothetical protein
MFKLTLKRRIFGLGAESNRRIENSNIIDRFIMFPFHQLLLGRSNERECDGQHV